MEKRNEPLDNSDVTCFEYKGNSKEEEKKREIR